ALAGAAKPFRRPEQTRWGRRDMQASELSCETLAWQAKRRNRVDDTTGIQRIVTNRRMERDEGIEPSPRPWQGRVLPLYESRENEFTFIKCRQYAHKARGQLRCLNILDELRTEGPPESIAARFAAKIAESMNVALNLIDFHDARGLDHRRALLPLGETGGSLAVNIDARKLLAVSIVDRDLPVAVLSAAVAAASAGVG